jgi:hypothetical protein
MPPLVPRRSHSGRKRVQGAQGASRRPQPTPCLLPPKQRRDTRTWDNNKGADYHTAVAPPADAGSVVETVLEAMKRESAAADAAAEERAAARAGEPARQRGVGRLFAAAATKLPRSVCCRSSPCAQIHSSLPRSPPAARRVESKARVARKRREVQHEVLYTVPMVPQAGKVRWRRRRRQRRVCWVGPHATRAAALPRVASIASARLQTCQPISLAHVTRPVTRPSPASRARCSTTPR